MRFRDRVAQATKRINLQTSTERAPDVRLVPYDPNWPAAFDHLKGEILYAIPESACSVEHIGSTSVPGLPAKPIIDAVVGLLDWTTVPAVIEALIGIGFFLGSTPDENLTYFLYKIEGSDRGYNLHITPADSPMWYDLLNFRDRLRNNVTLKLKYKRLKQSLSLKYPKDLDSYTISKTKFVTDVLAGSYD